MGFQGRADACKHHITKNYAKGQIEWSKARRYWTLEQWKPVLWRDESLFGSLMLVWV